MTSMIYKKRAIVGLDPSKYPVRMGQRWHNDEIMKLLISIGKKKSIQEIANDHQRTVQSIQFYIRKIMANYSDIQNSESTNKHMSLAYVYTLNLEGDNKYVGYTRNLQKRLNQHFSGNGAKWTQKYRPVSIENIKSAPSVACAKKLETFVYYKMKKNYGASKVRGAGNTKSY